MALLRKIAIWICIPIYKSIPDIYDIFYFLSNARFLTDTVIDNLSKNLYVLVSVVMLFTFSATLLSAIVNPDLLSDKKKGFWAVFKRSIIGIVLIVLIPFLFDEAYKLQGSIMKNSVIEKIIVGITVDTKEGNGGQVIAGSLLSSTIRPAKDGIKVSESELPEAYQKMITEDVDANIDTVAENINAKPVTDDTSSEEEKNLEYALEFDGLIALIAGGITVYILLLYAIDMAIRMFKLALLEITAPISVISYIAAGPDTLKKWGTEVLKTYVDVFIRVAIMGFYLFLINNLNNFLNTEVLWGVNYSDAAAHVSGVKWKFLLQVILIVGMLMFVKQIPDIINRAFGTSYKPKGGIGGRLGQMAVVGKQAQEAWGKVTKGLQTLGLTAAGVTAAGMALGPGGAIGAGIGLGLAHKAWNKGFDNKIFSARAGKDTAAGQTISSFGKKTGAFLSSGNPIKGAKAVSKMDAESDRSKQRKYDKGKKEDEKISEAANMDPITKRSIDGLLSSISVGFGNTKNKFRKNFKEAESIYGDYQTAKLKENALSEQIELEEKIGDAFKTASNAGRISADARKKVAQIGKNLDEGSITKTEAIAQLIDMEKNGEIDNKLRTDITKSISKSIKHANEIQNEAMFKGPNGKLDANIKMNSLKELKDSKVDFEKITASLKGDLDNYKLGLSESNKSLFDKYINQIDSQTSEWNRLASMNAPFSVENKTNYSPNTTQPIGSQNTQSTTNVNNINNNTQTSNQNIPTQNNGLNSYSNNASSYGMSQEAFDELKADSITPGSQEFENARRNYGYKPEETDNKTNNSNNNNNQSLGEQNLSGQNVTIKANTADVNAQSATVRTNTANIFGNKFDFNNDNNNQNNSDFVSTVSESSDDEIIEKLDELGETIKTSNEENADSINTQSKLNTKTIEKAIKKENEKDDE